MSGRASKQFQFRAMVLAVSAACVGFSVQAQEVTQKDKDGNPIQQVEISAKTEGMASGAKSNAPMRDLPMSISVVTAEVLQDQGALTLDAAIKNVSGLTQSSANNYGYFNNYLARGLPVNFLRDGMSDGPAVNGYVRTLTDVQQIEVLKGPGSALYGSGAPGGFVNLVTKKPEAKQAQSIEVGFGSFNAKHIKFDTTGPISANDGSIKQRLIASYSNTDGYRGFGNKTIEVLPSLSFNMGKGSVTALEIRHLDSTIHNDSVGMPFRNGMILDVPQANRYYTPFSKSTNKLDRVSLSHEMKLSDEWSLRANAAYGSRDLDFMRNVPNWRLNDPIKGTQMVNRTWRDQQDRLHDSAAQIEMIWNAATGGVRHEFMVGAAWSQTDGTAKRKQAVLAPITNIFAPVTSELANADLDEALAWNRDVKSAQSGLYLQDQIAVTKEIKVRAGLRYDSYKIDDNGDYNSLFDAGGAFLSTLAANKQSFVSKPAVMKHETASLSSTKVHPSLGAVYQPTDKTSYYVGASSGSFSNFNTEMGRTAFAPETSRQFEIGNKSVMMNGLISTNIAIYDTRRSDFLKTANGLTGTLGSSKTRGIDAELTARPFHGLQMRFAYAYQDAVHTKYLDVVSKKDDLVVIGKRLPGSSKNQMSVWTTYDLQSAEMHGFGFGGGLSYRDAFYADALNTNLAPAKPTLDLLAYYRASSYEVQANIGNATNARWYRYASGDGSVAPGDARALNVAARFKF